MGSDLSTGSLAKIKELVPNQIGENRRWTESEVSSIINLVAGVVAERVGYMHLPTEISLVGGQHEYSLPTSFISVDRVTYEEGEADSIPLMACTFKDLDRINLAWRDDTGSRPEFYTILDTPGSPSATLFVYPPQASTTGDTITVRGVAYSEGDTMDDIQDRCVVPYTLALLYAGEDLAKAEMFMSEAREGMSELRKQYADETLEGI